MRSELKVLYLTNSFPTKEIPSDGIFNYRRVEVLRKFGIGVGVVTYNNIIKKNGMDFKKSYNMRDAEFKDDLHVEVINYFRNPIFSKYGRLIVKIKNYFKKGNYDFIQTHFIWNGYLGYLLKRKYKIPYVLTVHGSDIHTDPFNNRKIKKITLQALNNADHVIFVSEYLLTKARQLGFKGKNYAIIANGIDPAKFKILDNNKPKDYKIVGFAGGLDPVKRALSLPDIFREINSLDPSIRFMIIGDGVLRKEVDEKLSKYGLSDKVEITGLIHPDEVVTHMNNIDVMILPSEKEGFPCVVMEAFASGAMVVGSANGGIPEAIGECGVLVKDGEGFEKRFALEVVKLLNNPIPKEKLVERTADYTWSEIVRKEIKVYEKVISTFK